MIPFTRRVLIWCVVPFRHRVLPTGVSPRIRASAATARRPVRIERRVRRSHPDRLLAGSDRASCSAIPRRTGASKRAEGAAQQRQRVDERGFVQTGQPRVDHRQQHRVVDQQQPRVAEETFDPARLLDGCRAAGQRQPEPARGLGRVEAVGVGEQPG